MRVAIVVNASSGTLLGREERVESIAAQLAAAGIDAVFEPDDGRPLPDRIAAAADHPVDAVVVAGGDGTIACAAQALADTGIDFGILPLGTANLLARDLGVPLDIAQAVHALGHGVVRDIDVGEVNGRVFLCQSVLGAASRLGVRRERSRGRFNLLKQWGFALATLRAMRRYPPLTLELDVNGRRRRLKTRAVAVIDNDYDETPGLTPTRSRLDSGRLAIYVTQGLTPMRMARLAFGFLVGRWRNAAGLTRYSAETFEIRSKRSWLRVMNDGETALVEPPLRYRIRPRALRVIVPDTAAAAAEAAPRAAA